MVRGLLRSRPAAHFETLDANNTMSPAADAAGLSFFVERI